METTSLLDNSDELEYRLNCRYHLRAFGRPMLGAILGVLVTMWWIGFSSLVGWVISLATFVVVTLPGIVVYLQFMYCNYGLSVRINMIERQVRCMRRGNAFQFSFGDIESISRVAPVTEKKWLKVGTTDAWYYYILTLRNGKRMILTCFMIDHLPDLGVPVEDMHVFGSSIKPGGALIDELQM